MNGNKSAGSLSKAGLYSEKLNSIFEEEESSSENSEGMFSSIFICENTDGVLDPIEQMIYALNETQVRYGSVVILKNAP